MGKFFKTTLAVAYLVLIGSCSFREVKDQPSEFPEEVNTILSRCLQCHSGASPAGGFGGVTDLNLLIAGEYIVPGEPDESILYQKLGANPPFGDRMPKGGPYLTSGEMLVMNAWISDLRAAHEVTVTSPTSGGAIGGSDAEPVSGLCTSNGAKISIYVNDVQSGADVVCSSGAFAGTVDMTGVADSATVTISARMTKNKPVINVSSSTISATKQSLLLTITSPSNANEASLRSKTQKDPTLIDDTNVTSYTVSGTCSAVGNGRTVQIVANTTTIGSATCTNGAWTANVNASALSDEATYKLTAQTTVGSTTYTSSGVAVYKFSGAQTYAFEDDIKPLFTTRMVSGGNSSLACIECHFTKTDGLAAAGSISFGYWNACPSGGRPTNVASSPACSDAAATTASNYDSEVAERAAFNFKTAYVNYTSTTAASNPTHYRSAVLVVNENPDAPNTVAGRIVRGRPNQSFMYRKTQGAVAPSVNIDGCVHTAVARSASGCNTGGTTTGGNRMPRTAAAGSIVYFTSGQQSILETWIKQGARLDTDR